MKQYGLLAALTLTGYLCFWQLAAHWTLGSAEPTIRPAAATHLSWLQTPSPAAGASKPAVPGPPAVSPPPAALPSALPDGAAAQAPTPAAVQESLGLFLADLDLAPYYPAAARERGIQGRVLLEITLGQGYRLQGVRLARQGPHPLLEQAAQRLVLEQGYKISAFLASRHGNGFHGGSLLVPVRFALL